MGIHHRQAKALETIAEEMSQIRRLFQKMAGESVDEKLNNQTENRPEQMAEKKKAA